MHSIIIFVAFAIVSQYNVFGAAFYEDTFNFDRRADKTDRILSGENLIVNVATADQIAQIEKLLPACLALSNKDLDKLFQAFLATHHASPGGRRKRSLDFLRRLEDSMYEDEQNDFDRRASDADKKVIAAQVSVLLKKLDEKSLDDLSNRIQTATGGGAALEKQFLASVIEFTGDCGKMAARRLFEVRAFLEEQMMNDDA